jgi:hypothetical protein
VRPLTSPWNDHRRQPPATFPSPASAPSVWSQLSCLGGVNRSWAAQCRRCCAQLRRVNTPRPRFSSWRFSTAARNSRMGKQHTHNGTDVDDAAVPAFLLSRPPPAGCSYSQSCASSATCLSPLPTPPGLGAHSHAAHCSSEPRIYRQALHCRRRLLHRLHLQSRRAPRRPRLRTRRRG